MKNRGCLAVALLALHLLAVGMAMSPTLHHWLHHDADAADHQCVATTMMDGQLDRPDTFGISASPAAPLLRFCKAIDSSRPMAEGQPLPHDGRAPPVG